MTSIHSTAITLAKRPVGAPSPSDFGTLSHEAPAPGAGEIQVRNSWMSVDPYMRGRMYDRESYVPPFQIGEVLTKIDDFVAPHLYPPRADGSDPRVCPVCGEGRLHLETY